METGRAYFCFSRENRMQTVLLVIQIMLAIALIGTILIQRTAQDGGGLMGGGNTMGVLFTARGSANVLTRTTAILATLFILNSLALGYIASSQHENHSLLDQIVPQTPMAPASAPAPVPAQPAVPAAPQVPLAK
jgi:preprotein translocase subunit SecG